MTKREALQRALKLGKEDNLGPELTLLLVLATDMGFITKEQITGTPISDENKLLICMASAGWMQEYGFPLYETIQQWISDGPASYMDQEFVS